MEDQPLVSIIIPSFNQEKFLKETLDSVLAQTYSNWECLVVDDGSVDRSIAIIRSYCQEDNRFALFERTNFTDIKGANACRNIGFKNSEGKYLIFLDSDDLLNDFCLKNRVAYFEKYAECDFLVFQMIMFNESGCISDRTITQHSENYLYEYLAYNVPWQTTCPIIKRTFIIQFLQGFDECFPRLQDPEFFTRALLIKGVNFKVFSELPPDCMYRHMSDRIANSSNAIKGFSLYITKFYPLIQERKDVKVCTEKLMDFYNSTFSSYLNRLQGTDKFDICKLLISYTNIVRKCGLISIQQNHYNKLQVYTALSCNIFKNIIFKSQIYLSFVVKLGSFFIKSIQTSTFFCFSGMQESDSTACLNLVKMFKQKKPIVILNNTPAKLTGEFEKSSNVFDFGKYIHNKTLFHILIIVLNWTIKRHSKPVFIGIADAFYYELLHSVSSEIIKVDIVSSLQLQDQDHAFCFSPFIVSKLDFRLLNNESEKDILAGIYHRNTIDADNLKKVLFLEELTHIKSILVS